MQSQDHLLAGLRSHTIMNTTKKLYSSCILCQGGTAYNNYCTGQTAPAYIYCVHGDEVCPKQLQTLKSNIVCIHTNIQYFCSLYTLIQAYSAA